MRSFDQVALRQMRTRKLRALLTGFGVVLGVGMVFGVLTLAGTIRHTFDDLIGSAWGTSDLIVNGKGGGLMAESTPAQVAATPGVERASPMIGSVFVRLGRDGEPVRGAKGRMFTAGYDTTKPAPYDFRMVAGRPIGRGREVMVERNWARDRGVRLGEAMPVATPAGRATLRVVGIFKLSNNLSFGGQGIAAMPVDAGRRLMQIPRGWMQLSVAAHDRADVDALQARLKRELGTGVEVQTPQGVADRIGEQLSALNVVLYFFSAIAIFVGGFLILNSFNMTVLQRMREIGTLRTLGATRGMVVRTVLTEAMVLAIAGSAIGLLLGLGLAKGLMAAMGAFGIPVGSLHLTVSAALIAVATGVLVTLAGAGWPARRAGRISPIRAVLGQRPPESRRSARRALIGLALFLPGALLGGQFWFGNTSETSTVVTLLGIAATFAMFGGMVAAAPQLIMPVVRVLAVPLRRVAPTGGRLAADAVSTNPARSAATAVALTIGISVVMVNATMSGSFVGTIKDQFDANLARDFTVQASGSTLEQPVGTVAPALRREIAAMPETRIVTPERSVLVDLPQGGGKDVQGLVVGVDPADYGVVDRTPVKGVSRDDALRDVATGGALIGQSFASAAGLEQGDTFVLRGAAGKQRIPVAGVLDALTPFNGNYVQVSLATMRRVYGEAQDVQLAVKARSAAAAPALERRVQALVDRRYPQLELLSTTDLKRQVERQIDQQFGLFNAMVGIAIIVSILGVVNTLAMSVIERTREIGVLRALGSSRLLVRLTMLHESLLITVSGAIAGVATGALIGISWTRGLDSLLPGFSVRFPVSTVLLVVVASIVLGVIAAIVPARRAARLQPIQAVSYE
jgi:putative ABC transport system permease protein